jgi:hypothetical protein
MVISIESFHYVVAPGAAACSVRPRRQLLVVSFSLRSTLQTSSASWLIILGVVLIVINRPVSPLAQLAIRTTWNHCSYLMLTPWWYSNPSNLSSWTPPCQVWSSSVPLPITDPIYYLAMNWCLRRLPLDMSKPSQMILHNLLLDSFHP